MFLCLFFCWYTIYRLYNCRCLILCSLMLRWPTVKMHRKYTTENGRVVCRGHFWDLISRGCCWCVVLLTVVRMISEVQLFVGELRRITLLWDELWLGALSQLYQDVMRRLKQLENEMAKVSSNMRLSPEEAKAIIQKKHMTVLKPVSQSILCTSF